MSSRRYFPKLSLCVKLKEVGGTYSPASCIKSL